jgi:predicted nucleic acid-binding protein
MLVYLDACILIYVVEAVEPWKTRVTELLASNGLIRLVVSDLVRMECLVVPYRSGDLRLIDDFERQLAECEIAPILASTFDFAAHIRADHGLKTPDAIHLAAAVESGCAELWTNDDRFARAAGKIVIRRLG